MGGMDDFSSGIGVGDESGVETANTSSEQPKIIYADSVCVTMAHKFNIDSTENKHIGLDACWKLCQKTAGCTEFGIGKPADNPNMGDDCYLYKPGCDYSASANWDIYSSPGGIGDAGDVPTAFDPCSATLSFIEDEQDTYKPPDTIPYDKVAANMVKIGSGWTTFFTNGDSIQCPITDCRLLQYDGSSCTEPY